MTAGGGTPLLHIVERQAWDEARARGELRPPSLATAGFVHLSRPHQLIPTAELHYRGRDGLVVLVVDPARLAGVEVVDELAPGRGERFPHLYGPLPVSAVVRVVPFPCRPDGGFDLPPEIQGW